MLPLDVGSVAALRVEGLVLTVPHEARLSAGGLAHLERVLGALVDAPDAARGLAREFEELWGVTDAHREVVAQSHSRAWLNAQARAEQASAPVPEKAPPPRLSEQELVRLEQAQAKLTSKSRKQRAEGKRQVLALERTLEGRARFAEEREIESAVDETAELSRIRGELIGVDHVAGRRRATRLGGLQLAFERGVLDTTSVRGESLMRAAELYRDLYEIAVGQRGPDRTENLAMGGVSSGFGPKSMLPQVRAGRELQYARDGLTKVQRDTCDLVCGLDCTVNEAARRMSKNPRTLEKALAEGLKRVGENRMWW